MAMLSKSRVADTETAVHERVMQMRKWHKTISQDLGFVRKYCFAKTYPASDARCRYVKAKIIVKSAAIPLGGSSGEVDGIFLCRYPDEKMPLHRACLTSELNHCPNPERREMIDGVYGREV
jgi:hypothetical protein